MLADSDGRSATDLRKDRAVRSWLRWAIHLDRCRLRQIPPAFQMPFAAAFNFKESFSDTVLRRFPAGGCGTMRTLDAQRAG